MRKGHFIVFEGIDGCGKSTQVKKFSQYLFEKNKYDHIIMTRNPYRNVRIREILKEDRNPLSFASALADLFIADRALQVINVILPALNMGHHVISDRFKLSTIAYQAAQGMDMHDLIRKHSMMPVPDFTFVIDTPAGIARKRMEKESHRSEHKFEKNVSFAESVRLNYAKARNILKDENIFMINGNNSPDKVFSSLISLFKKHIDKGGQQKGFN